MYTKMSLDYSSYALGMQVQSTDEYVNVYTLHGMNSSNKESWVIITNAISLFL